MDIVSMSPSNIEMKNSTLASNMTNIDEFLKRIHTNHIAQFDIWAEKFGLPLPEKLFDMFELSNVEIYPKSGYFELNFTPTFVSPDKNFERFTP